MNSIVHYDSHCRLGSTYHRDQNQPESRLSHCGIVYNLLGIERLCDSGLSWRCNLANDILRRCWVYLQIRQHGKGCSCLQSADGLRPTDKWCYDQSRRVSRLSHHGILYSLWGTGQFCGSGLQWRCNLVSDTLDTYWVY
mgnify:CR=1 FL=1